DQPLHAARPPRYPPWPRRRPLGTRAPRRLGRTGPQVIAPPSPARLTSHSDPPPQLLTADSPLPSDEGGPMGPLAGITILDLAWVLSGPFASMTLCDLGAEVIKLERPPYGDIARTTSPFINDESCYFYSVNRGKKSLSIDLRRPEGKELFLKLCERVDVIMENFTPGTMDRLGIGWEVLSKRNPRLIYAAVSGFGQTGPDRGKSALDIIVQGMGGVMSITGEP